MWHRVEINRDGSVKSCEPVEARSSGSALVVFVDSDDAAGAVTKALEWRERFLAKARATRASFVARRKEAGICRDCPRTATNGGICDVCRAKLRFRPSQTGAPPTFVATGPTNEGMLLRRFRQELPIFERCYLNSLEMSPAKFRKWLEAQIEQRHLILDGVKPAAEVA